MSGLFAESEKAAPFVRDWRITCGDYREALDAPGNDVWCVLDAPYYKNTLLAPSAKLYRYNFTIAQHRQLAAAVATCGHNLLLTYDNCKFIRQLYEPLAGFRFYEDVWTYCGASGREKQKGKELLITNYTPVGLT